MRTFTIFLGILLLFFNNVFAQKKLNDSTKVEKLDAVIVTAQYAPQSEKNAVYKVKILSSKTINKKAANNLRELLQQELDLDLSQKSVFGSSLELQGISKENIKILIDGVPVIGRLNGVIDLNQINLSAIERVEIIEGPVSVFYGTDAMGGIINLISKKNQKETVAGEISSYYESINAANYNGNFGYKYGKNMLRINGGYYHFNGLATNDSPRNLNWEERGQYFGGLMFSKDLDNLTLRFNSNLSHEKLASLGEPSRRSGKITDTDYFTRRIDNSLNLQGEVLKNKFIDITASYLDYQRYHDDYNVNATTQEKTLSTTDIKANNIVKYSYSGLKAQLGKSDNTNKINYAFGTDYNKESTEGGRILNRKQFIQTLALFGSLNYKLSNNFEIQPSSRYTWNSTYGSLFSPAINTKLRIDNQNQLRFSYARGFRAPSLKELFLDFHISAGPFTYIISGNESLDVEKSHSFNLNYTFEKSLNNSGFISIEPSFFYNDISNLIALSEMVDSKRHYMNIEKFKSLGGKIDITYKPYEALSLKAGISITGRYNKFNETYNTQKYLYSPELTTNINYEIKKRNLNISIYNKFSGKREGFFIDSTDAIIKTTRNSFDNLSSTVSKSFLNETLHVSLGVKNALNVKDVETLNEIGQAHSRNLELWGRSFFLKTTFNL
ncbi:MAG: TonB-dependent receptor [Flavobacteriaceae bacterium]|nr:TonB-dependent receptor [Flavobacteriaceae bacterium]